MSHNKNVAKLARLLGQCDAPRGLIGKLVATHGATAYDSLTTDPYGILHPLDASLEVADKVAMAAKLPLEQRVLGHSEWLLASKILNASMLRANLQFAFEMPAPTIQTHIDNLVKKKHLVKTDKYIVSAAQYQKHVDVARQVDARCQPIAPHKAMRAAFQDIQGLSDTQKQALDRVWSSRISIITGGPGGGKSFCVRQMLQAFPNAKVTAPTGRAARNASGKTVHYFKTIQEAGQNEFKGVELVIVDEASMLSTELFWIVLSLLPDNAHLVLVGDVNQLPPIDTGDVLRDLIDAGKVPTTFLNENYRSNTGIQRYSQQILQGAVEECPDVEFVVCESYDDVMQQVPTMLKTLQDAGESYMFLTPHNVTRIALNKVIQMVTWSTRHGEVEVKLNAPFADLPKGTECLAQVENGTVHVLADEVSFSVRLSAASKLVDISGELKAEANTYILQGDDVIITKNTTDACNGDIGIFCGGKTVEFEDRTVEIADVTETDPGMTLAYAVTVHKAQGSEFGAVVLPIVNTNSWDKTLFYTAVTRAKSKVYLLGSQEDVDVIIKTCRPPKTSILRGVL